MYDAGWRKFSAKINKMAAMFSDKAEKIGFQIAAILLIFSENVHL